MHEFKTTNIKGKEYVQVNERILYFRKVYPLWTLETEVLKFDSEQILLKAVIKDETGRIIANGLAHEEKSSSRVNETSFVENAETSAWGRALGNMGIGIETSIASAEEMQIALKKQEDKKPTAKRLEVDVKVMEEVRNIEGLKKMNLPEKEEKQMIGKVVNYASQIEYAMDYKDLSEDERKKILVFLKEKKNDVFEEISK